MYHGYCKNCFSPTMDKEWGQRARPFLVASLSIFVGNDHETDMYLNCVCDGFKTMLLPLLNLNFCVVIIIFELRCMLNYLWSLCNIWHVCWIMYDLGLYVGYESRYFATLDRLPVYMGSSMTVWPSRWLSLYLCSYKLVGSVTANEVDETEAWLYRWGQEDCSMTPSCQGTVRPTLGEGWEKDRSWEKSEWPRDKDGNGQNGCGY